MAKLAYITGSSRGIGKALSELLLANGYSVVGISRQNSIDHPGFRHISLDLSDLKAVNEFWFEEQADEVILVNNAGRIGEIGPIGTIPNMEIEKVMNINTLAPQIFSNKFVKRFLNSNGKFQILNISSGAGKKAITSWATYCASKAAIDLFSETLSAELEWQEKDNWFIHSTAPGVVDTAMQDQIRSSSKTQFQHIENFVAYKENNELYTPEYVASKLFEIIQYPERFPDVVNSVRDY